MTISIYEKYGGFRTFNNVIKEFYTHVKKSPTLFPYFEGVGMGKLIEHQTQFISSLLGGPEITYELSLKDSHKHLFIPEEHYNEIVQILLSSLERAGLEPEELNEILVKLNSLKSDIIKS